MSHILVVDDEEETRLALMALIGVRGLSCSAAGTLVEARSRISERRPTLALCDLVLPDGSGMTLFDELTAIGCDVVITTGHASLDSAIRALRSGASDYLVKPIDMQRVEAMLTRNSRRAYPSDLLADLADEWRETGRFGLMLGRSEPMLDLYGAIARVAATDASVLLTGESGTGKELAAQTIHERSLRHSGPFVAINCGALPTQLIESEMFGHARGSFTGADREHRGFFERAHGGTLFLDEITEMPIDLQVRLLRVLETRRVLRLGGSSEIDVDVRIVAATNRDPLGAIDDGELRHDLYHRINVFPIPLPPLRERGRDVVLLAEAFLARFNEAMSRALRFSEDAKEALTRHHWPGNVRELRNLVQRAVIFAEGESIDTLPVPILEAAWDTTYTAGETVSVEFGMPLEELDRRLIAATLARCGGVKAHAAKMLEVSLKTVYNRLGEVPEKGI
ncbi:sigma-54-dependent transcriptional regulator [Burkholderia glumae]|uniref:Sigma-54-dependent Fis family transcriptional regulator n=1 Tax=Burkholderia glumae TaxID=337 RepID=A0AAP9Y6J2_BURGL|nr:sigma-54 dependent transcriptional regulator [Burkholderia glumae]ACR32693.1 Fis family two component sigma54 specific transcriptional regulator [Burkholderia glumae BGR1]AJY62520.1 AAA domain family protein [Burkholderia glumae LMG 2196 = ATCC 33617]KHJ59689.1 Fis family transcriptional regulator [Burkholderia glumae]MCM2485727.1 sigma-54 dependent transcriptional regulator [Burkholderia glumae]MCM2496158.1 sigma-54 dependent transcriptional regulator [Burkholderia glumae]